MQEFEQTSNISQWQEQAYEVDDKDQEAYFPWGPLWWFFLAPLLVFSPLYLALETAWSQDPLFPGAGSVELRRWLTLMHSIAGHWSLFYQTQEWHGWWYVPDFERPDNSASDPDDLPVMAYFHRWDKDEAESYYPVPMHNYHWVPSSVAPFGTSQPIGLLEEYRWGRRLVYLLPFILLPLIARAPLILRPSSLGPVSLRSQHNRWPFFAEKLNTIHKLIIWYWK